MTRKKQEKQGWGVPFLNKVARKVVTEQVDLESNPRGGDEVNRRDVGERSAAESRPDSAKVLRQGLPGESNKSRQECRMNVGRGMEEEVIDGMGDPLY